MDKGSKPRPRIKMRGIGALRIYSIHHRDKSRGLLLGGVKLSSYRGASAVEFAIILPILILLVFGIVEFSLALYDKAMITNASREGARAGIVSQIPRVTDTEIKNIVDKYCKDNLITFGEKNDPITAITRTGFSFGDDLTVTVMYNYSFLVLPKFVTDFTGLINLSGTTVMKIE